MKIWLIPIVAVFLMLTGCQKSAQQLEMEKQVALAAIAEQARQQERERDARMRARAHEAELDAQSTQRFFEILGAVASFAALAVGIAISIKLGLRFHAHQLEARRRQDRFKTAAEAFTKIAHNLPQDQRETLLTKLMADARAGENIALQLR